MSKLWFRTCRAIFLVFASCLLMLYAAPVAHGQATGRITGTVNDDATSAPLAGILVNVHQIAGAWEIVGSALSGADGFYDVGNLNPGVYHVEFVDPSGYHVSEYYDNIFYVYGCADVTVGTGQVTAGINATLTGAGHISGTVTSHATGAPLPGIQVSVCWRVDGHCHTWDVATGAWRSVATREDGAYDLGSLPPGLYRLRFQDAAGIYRTEYYNDAQDFSEATEVQVIKGQTTPGIDAALLERGRITGTVTDAISGKPLSGILVRVFESWNWSSWFSAGETSTLADGSYSLRMYYADSYRVEFTDPQGNYAPGTLANVIVYHGRITADVDATMVPWGRITGTVTTQMGDEPWPTAMTGRPLRNIQVAVLRSLGAVGWETVRSVTTDSEGGWDSGGLPPGAYQVRFSDPDGKYQTVFYEDTMEHESATAVSVILANTTTDINAMLMERGRIAGTIRSQGAGQPLAGIRVIVYSSHWSASRYEPIATVFSDADGRFDSGGLDAASYRLYFEDPNSEYASADFGPNVQVTAAHVIAGIKIALRERGRISGKVIASDTGLPLSEIRVGLLHLVEYLNGRGVTVWYWVEIAATATSADGRYQFDGLVNDAYLVGFTDPTKIYNSAQTDAIHITDYQVVTGIDVALDRWESITGHVRGTVMARRTGMSLPGISILLIRYNGAAWDLLVVAYTDVGGAYDISGLPPGVYRVQFYDRSGVFETQFYDGAADLASGADINIAGGVTAQNINAQLVECGRITGKVVAATTGQPLPGIAVRFIRDGVQWPPSQHTDAGGLYASGPLTAGIYEVQFQDDEGNRYEPQSVQASVVVEQITSGIDTALVERGYITGQVTAEGTGASLPGASVRSYRVSDLLVARGILTDAEGVYKAYLPAGAYRLGFAYPTFIAEFYDNATSLEAGTDVFVVRGQATTGINAALMSIADHSTPMPTVTPEATPTAAATLAVTLTPTAIATSPLHSEHWHIYMPLILR